MLNASSMELNLRGRFHSVGRGDDPLGDRSAEVVVGTLLILVVIVVCGGDVTVTVYAG